MDRTQRSQPNGPAVPAQREPVVRRFRARGARSHFLVACLAGGLQAAYAPQPESEVSDLFAGLIAQLDFSEPGTR
ncbi:hypothetical protein [Methylobacterium sp. V23]|jgi:hypothetical protein|uniref:hypothetical protein n=1 Tax=Methylobacterium sp. V23 TaxID=2044878 RepID=UPI000CDB8BBF|nr:hypothetical protein [Methylobacterium sp. V23]POR40965.1 hypothetical protein CRT23_20960 [Methylobacterium sp. V23]